MDLSKARLFHTDLRGADLRGARLPSDMKEVKHDAKTRWPRGFRPESR
ncbi:pentapeptide repeat-containing protein [Cystobacter fuscus]|nr:pentapeptide repeat-containing protein [Cystobacter fuscus]